MALHALVEIIQALMTKARHLYLSRAEFADTGVPHVG